MKKSVIILIGVIYFAAIAMVSFFGLMPEIYVTEQKMESVTIFGDDIVISSETGNKYVIIYPNEDGVWEYQLQYTISPDNTSNTVVDFIFEADPSVSVSSTGLVTMTEFGSTIIKIMATDGSGASDTVTIYAME